MKKNFANRTPLFFKSLAGWAQPFLPLLCVFVLLAGIAHAIAPPAVPVAKTALILIPVKNLINPIDIKPKTLTGHSNSILSVAFSPDGGTLASGSADNSVILWDVTTGDKLKTLTGHSNLVHSVSFSPNGRTLASGSYDKSVIIWDVATGDKLKTLTGHTDVIYSVAFSPDSKSLASGSYDDSVIIWDVSTGDKLKTLTGHSNGVRSVSFSPDSKSLASGNYDKSVIIWDMATGDKLKTLKGHSNVVLSVAFSPDSKSLASGSYDKSVIVWDAATGDKLKILTGHSDYITSVSFSPDSMTLASGSKDKSVILWDAVTGDKLKTITGHSNTIRSVSFSPDGKMVASGSEDNRIMLRATGLKSLLEKNMAAFKKDEFETAQEYEYRLGKIEVPYSSPIALGRYDADGNGFEAELQGNKIFIYVAREKARAISGKKGTMRVEGRLKYYDQENMALVEANVIDTVSNDRFAIYKMTEGAAVASTPKLALKSASQAAYASAPAFSGAVVSEIDAIPDFKTRSRPNDIAIVIGIENYQSVSKSDFSKSDAILVKGYLKAMGFQERNIASLSDEQATFSGIKKTVESWLPNRVKSDSKVFVYYSGHGAPEPDTGEAYIVPYDGDPNYLPDTAYPIKRLYEKLGKLKAAEVVVALDSCFSGSGGRSVLAKGARPLVMMVDTIPASNMAVLTATNGAQISTSSPEKGHGVFTYYFLKALKDGKGTVTDIYEYIKPLVEDEAMLLNVQQSPGLSPAPEVIKGRFNLSR